jgi:2-methylcitrate dehydratase PrpD
VSAARAAPLLRAACGAGRNEKGRMENMTNNDENNTLDRRLFLGASAVTLLGLPGAARAQQVPAGAAKVGEAEGKNVTEIIARYVAGFDLKSVPADVINRARVGFIDTIGVMLAGSREEVAHIVVDMVKLEGSTPAVGIVGQSLRTSPQLAALANGVAGHAMDYDMSFLSGQAVSGVIPAILPFAEQVGATPAECVAAFIIGCEVGARVFRASPDISNLGGFHTTGVIGTIAATAACARLLKLPPDKIAEAIGISTSLASGIAANYGSMTKPLHAGNAARNGVTAALLASRGFTSQATAFESSTGFYNTFGRGLGVSYEPFKDLGSRYDVASLGFRLKAYPCGGRGHPAIEIALSFRDALRNRLSEITNIHCQVTKTTAARVGVGYPRDVEAAKFSASYVVAYSLVHGAPRIPAFTEAALRDERVKAVAKTVTASADPTLIDGPDGSPVKMKITLKDGQVFEQRRDYATGSGPAPMTQVQVEEKFLDCATQTLSADAAKKVLAALNALPDRASFNDVWPLLRPA